MNLVSGNVEKADGGMVGRGNFLLCIHGLADGPFHVGLTRANPDFAHQDIVEGDLVLPLDGHLPGLFLGLEG